MARAGTNPAARRWQVFRISGGIYFNLRMQVQWKCSNQNDRNLDSGLATTKRHPCKTQIRFRRICHLHDPQCIRAARRIWRPNHPSSAPRSDPAHASSCRVPVMAFSKHFNRAPSSPDRDQTGSPDRDPFSRQHETGGLCAHPPQSDPVPGRGRGAGQERQQPVVGSLVVAEPERCVSTARRWANA